MAKQAAFQVSPAKPAVAEKSDPVAALGLSVLVQTTSKINGQSEHAAMITQVWDDDVVNVMVFPGEGQPYPIARISRIKHSATGSLSWRWPPR